MKSLSITERQITDGERAHTILAAAGGHCPACGHDQTMFETRVKQIVKDTVGWFRTAAGPDRDLGTALRYIAALSEVMAFKEELEYQAKKGDEARARLVETATGEK